MTDEFAHNQSAQDRFAEKTIGERVYFDALLRPNRSLGRLGFAIVMTVAAAFGIGIGVAFLLAGAWPVTGFCGLEVALLYIAFRLNYRSGRAGERIRLTDGGLQVRRFGPGGETGCWEIEPSWLRVGVEEPTPRGGRLTLSSHGRTIALGAFLTPAERREVADALRAALARYRSAPDRDVPDRGAPRQGAAFAC